VLFADMTPLFAQVNRQFGPAGGNPPPGDPAAAAAAGGMMAVFLVGYFVFLAVVIVVTILFLLSLSKALKACSSRNRTMEPGQVWLSLIPLVGIVFYIMAILKVPESLANEYRDRGLRGDGDFGKTLGIWFIVASFLCPGVNFILWIMYWVKISGYTKELTARAGRREYARDDEDDDEDDRPRRRSRRDED
jgi:heme/copper-type cytochrome/quinol oxidase subunit 2